MDAERFAAVLFMLIPQVVQLIAERHKTSEEDAVGMFYHSRLYALLETEETKVWHYSPQLLFALYDEEARIGTITFPEEAA